MEGQKCQCGPGCRCGDDCKCPPGCPGNCGPLPPKMCGMPPKPFCTAKVLEPAPHFEGKKSSIKPRRGSNEKKIINKRRWNV